MPFVKGNPDANRKGRPSVENQKQEPEHVQEIKASELRASVRRLRLAVPKALALLIEAMENEDIDLEKRLKYGKEIYDLYLKSVGMDMSLKKAKHAMKTGKDIPEKDDDEEKVKVPAVVFTLHESKKTGTKE